MQAPVLTLDGPTDSLVLRPMVVRQEGGRKEVLIRIAPTSGRFGLLVPLGEFVKVREWFLNANEYRYQKCVLEEEQCSRRI